LHVLKNASGRISRKVDEIFGEYMPLAAKKELCTLIYYPEQKLELVKNQYAGQDAQDDAQESLEEWYRMILHQLVKVFRVISSKYTRSKVRKSFPPEYSYILEELLHTRTEERDKAQYVNVIIDEIISTDSADDFITAIANVIQRLAIDQLHILGDIYDRGPGAHIIMDTLRQYHSWDIQWGNHDILWMGAAAGNNACICNVLRLCLRYANLTTIEEYGINLVPLATFALDAYRDDPCEEFIPKVLPGNEIDEKTRLLTAKMHKAIAVIQFKEEAAIYNRRPEWQMQDRNLFEQIDYTRGVCRLDGKEYEMRSCHFPTIDPAQPNALTAEEADLMEKLHHSFRICEKLKKHIRTLLSHGCMYTISNSNLLFHASCPLNDDGSLKEVEVYPGVSYSGKDLMHNIGMIIRAAFEGPSDDYPLDYARDYFLYLWCGKNSPLFDKSKMATFERYFLKDKETYKEDKGNYFKLRDSEAVCDQILDAFEVQGRNRHIINGHVPVHASKGENPIKAGGKLMVIDGGFSEAYHHETGIAGYTLVYHSRGFQLVQHEPFTSQRDAIMRETDIKSTTQIVEMSAHRMLVADTDKGADLKRQVADLKKLLYAYRHGILKERRR
jgi:fructose-1,6-bisphosphatase-3